MARASGSSTTPSLCSLFFVYCLLLFAASSDSEALDARPRIVDGLSWNYYWLSCPRLESIVRRHLQKGCDGSILLDGSPNERDQPAKIGIRPEALKTFDPLFTSIAEGLSLLNMSSLGHILKSYLCTV
ncbi:hypothetical protein Fmac_023711 [Flemingia macrophylla]|uniref:Uncharacterized protein n=1 Tax=Flemingia macrophylla TaxID=520843 RepID=A0ABD1LMG0_9FABA